jgi:hypothetical protein
MKNDDVLGFEMYFSYVFDTYENQTHINILTKKYVLLMDTPFNESVLFDDKIKIFSNIKPVYNNQNELIAIQVSDNEFDQLIHINDNYYEISNNFVVDIKILRNSLKNVGDFVNMCLICSINLKWSKEIIKHLTIN